MRQLVIIVVALVFTHAAWSGDFEDGWVAYERKDYATAFSKFRSAAQQGNVRAQALLGMMYDEGLGVRKDHKEAVRWWLLAGQQGNLSAQYSLGVMYSQGTGVVQDYTEALRWYQLAARQGFADAQHNLGKMYGIGQGVLQDYTRAHMWFNIAAINGDKDSVIGRDTAARFMTPQQIEHAQRMARECMASNFKNCD